MPDRQFRRIRSWRRETGGARPRFSRGSVRRAVALLAIPLFFILVAVLARSLLLIAWEGRSPAVLTTPPAGPTGNGGTGGSATSLSFVVFSDTHQQAGSPGIVTSLWPALGRIAPAPAFGVNMGDVTDTGQAEEFRAYAQVVDAGKNAVPSISLYHVPGNHDVRWSAWGDALWRMHFGQPFWSFDLGGVHFVGLDSTQLLQEAGHFDRAQLDWLDADLQNVGTQRPVILFLHHPVGGDFYFVDNQHQLFELLRPYNVRAIFAGHVHRQAVTYQNGIAVITTPAARDAGVHLLGRLRGGLQLVLEVYQRTAEGRQQHLLNVPLTGSRPGVPISRVEASVEGRLQVQIAGDGAGMGAGLGAGMDEGAGAGLGVSAGVKSSVGVSRVEYRVDLPVYSASHGGDWRPLQPVDSPRVADSSSPTDTADLGDAAGDNLWEAELPDLTPGRHLVLVRSVDEKGAFWTGYATIVVERPPAPGIPGVSETPVTEAEQPLDMEMRVAWEDRLGAAIPAGVAVIPLSGGDAGATGRAEDESPEPPAAVVVAATTDGQLWGLNATTGEMRWRLETEGGFYSSPVVDGERKLVYAATSRGRLYAIDAASGSVIWEFTAPMPILGTPLLAAGTLFVPAGSQLYTVDPEDGATLWVYTAGGFIGGQPAADGETVYFGAGDGWVRAVARDTGQLVWQRRVGNGLLYGPWASRLQFIPDPDGRVIATTVRGAWALEPGTGREAWQVGGGFAYSSPLVIQDESGQPRVVFADEWGWLTAVDPAWGSLKWRTPTGERILDSSPVVGPGPDGRLKLYVVGVLGTLLRVDPETGAIEARLHLTSGAYVFSSPATWGNLLFVGGQDGIVRAVRLQSEQPERSGGDGEQGGHGEQVEQSGLTGHETEGLAGEAGDGRGQVQG